MKFSPVVWIGLLPLCLSPNGHSATTNAYEVPPIMVTATRVARLPENIPAQVTVITAEEIREHGAQTVVEALRDLGGIYFRSLNGNPAQAEVSLRGFGENSHGRVLVLRDGQRMNSPDLAGINWLQIPLASVERIEVLRGGHNMLYGDHALAGVIRVVTRRDAGENSRGMELQAGSYGSRGARLALTHEVDGTQTQAGIDWQTSDGYRENGGFDAFNFRAGLWREFEPGMHLRIDTAFDRYENGLPGYLSRDEMREYPRRTHMPDDEVLTDNYNAAAGMGMSLTEDWRFDLDLIYNRKDMESDMSSWYSFSDTVIDSLTLNAKQTWEGRVLGYDDRLLSGIDLYYDRLAAERFGEKARLFRLLDAQVEKFSAGAYLSNEFDLAPTLTVSLGGRLERTRLTAEVADGTGSLAVDDRGTYNVQAAEASLLYRPADNARLYLRAASLYRIPLLDEQVSYYGYGSDRFYSNLEAETGYNYELGGSWHAHGGWFVEGALFHLEMRNEIAYNPVDEVNENMDASRRRGAETALGWERTGLGSCRLRWTVTDAAFAGGAYDGEDVPLVPASQWALNTQAELPFDLTLQAILHYVGPQGVGGDYANEVEKLPSSTTLDLGLSFRPERFDGLVLMLGCANVFDKNYANVAYLGSDTIGYYPSPGRTWRTSLSFAF